MRIAFTIILNGLHHLKHNNQAEFISQNFDYWVVVEGATRSQGSTGWCRQIPDKYHNNGKSIDGTVEFMNDFKENHSNVIFVESNGLWNSKDDMVNTAISEIKKITNECFLWEIDVDEQWSLEQIENSEKELIENDAKMGCFIVNQYLGDNLIAYGSDWAGNPFNRLWNWKGENFECHEPPRLSGGNGKTVILSEKMEHYSYYFEEDVKFKDEWYGGHQGVYEGWKKLKTEQNFPQHISYMFPGFPRHWNSYIIKKN